MLQARMLQEANWQCCTDAASVAGESWKIEELPVGTKFIDILDSNKIFSIYFRSQASRFC